ncbi:MAG TPA: peptidoglycan-binding domain-containing protein [Terriglobia bacterium]|nr:peptidoglycan-binding domain-containing protein [Terriglobia bacterium]
MTSRNAVLSRMAVAGAGILAVFLCAGRARAQAEPAGPAFETIEVTGARPVARAMDVIEQRYGVLIDYMDAPWVAPQDRQLYRSVQGIPPLTVTSLGPKTWTISVHYWEAPGTPESVAPIYRCNTDTLGCAPVTARPQEGIEGLIQEVLHQFAEQGGPIFAVRSLEMPYGARDRSGTMVAQYVRWEVYPIYARDRSGTMVAQPDFLSAMISIPKARRWPADMFNLIVQQLDQTSGAKFSVGLLQYPIDQHVPRPGEQPPELGAENVSAWRAIADLMLPRDNLGVIRVLYGVCEPDCGYDYGVSVVGLPYREPPRPPTPKPAPAKFLRMRPRGPDYWLARARTPEGIQEVQQTLAKLGYLGTPPTTSWDANAIAALKRFQHARGLPEQEGKLDIWTAGALMPSLPYVPGVPVFLRAEPAMSVALLDWLNSTPDGWKEVQRTLAKEGFYNGPIDGKLYVPTKKALKAFQTANGLEPSGVVDWDTAVKLSPYLSQPN